MRADMQTMQKSMSMSPAPVASSVVKKDQDPMFKHCQSMPGMSGCAEILARGSSPNMSMEDHMNMSSDPMAMSMVDMGKMLEGKTGDALDRAFLEGMIPHHQGAVDMARVLTGAKHPELRKMGEDIIRSQTAEIEQMRKWQKEWYPVK